jgi:hypothetical protein
VRISSFDLPVAALQGRLASGLPCAARNDAYDADFESCGGRIRIRDPLPDPGVRLSLTARSGPIEGQRPAVRVQANKRLKKRSGDFVDERQQPNLRKAQVKSALQYRIYGWQQRLQHVVELLVLATPEGTSVMPPQRGMWIPPTTLHGVRMVGEVSMQSLYLEPDLVPNMPERCQVVGISSFMRSLLTEALDLPLEYELTGRAGALMTLIRHEMRQLPVLPLSLPYPANGALATRCRQFLRRPSIRERIDDWSEALGMSRRSFTRLFMCFGVEK